MAAAPKYYVVHLPCKPYIRKYAASMYGYPVPAHNKSSIGCFVQACLVKERYTERTYTQSFIHANYTAQLSFLVSAWVWVNIGFDFTTAKVVEINQFLESAFEEHMHLWVDIRHLEGKTERRRLIEDFAEAHSIALEEDISLDALVKTEYRHRKALAKKREKAEAALAAEEKIFSAKLSGQKPLMQGNIFCKTVRSEN